MKKSIYAVYDSVSEVFDKPIAEYNDESAIRAFTQALSETPHKNDYQLFRLGTFNDSNGEIEPEKSPQRIYQGLDIKNADIKNIKELKS